MKRALIRGAYFYYFPTMIIDSGGCSAVTVPSVTRLNLRALLSHSYHQIYTLFRGGATACYRGQYMDH